MKTKNKPIWERRNQTFAEYQKRSINDETVFEVKPSKHIKKEPQGESITTLKDKARILTGKKITRAQIRKELGREKGVKNVKNKR